MINTLHRDKQIILTKELIFDINIMTSLINSVDIRVLNRMLMMIM
jgi:hypothetical protein